MTVRGDEMLSGRAKWDVAVDKMMYYEVTLEGMMIWEMGEKEGMLARGKAKVEEGMTIYEVATSKVAVVVNVCNRSRSHQKESGVVSSSILIFCCSLH